MLNLPPPHLYRLPSPQDQEVVLVRSLPNLPHSLAADQEVALVIAVSPQFHSLHYQLEGQVVSAVSRVVAPAVPQEFLQLTLFLISLNQIVDQAVLTAKEVDQAVLSKLYLSHKPRIFSN